MTWRKGNAPDGDETIMLLAADDAGFAIKHGDQWFLYDVDASGNPTNGRFVEPAEVRAWSPLPRSAEEVEQLREEVERWAEPPEQKIKRAEADLVAIKSELSAIEEWQRAEEHKAEQRAADQDEREAEQERLQQWRDLLP